MDLIHWIKVVGKLDGLLAIHISDDYICKTASRRFILYCLRFFTVILRNCQNKRFFLSLDVSLGVNVYIYIYVLFRLLVVLFYCDALITYFTHIIQYIASIYIND